MTLLRLRVSPYGILDEISSTELNILNDEIENAFDASGGGAYTLTAPASIGGDFLTISSFANDAVANFTGITNFDGPVNVTFAIAVDGTSSAEIDFTDGSTLRGAAGTFILWDGTATFGDAVTLNDEATFNGSVTYSNTSLTLFQGPASFAATLLLSGTTTITGAARLQAPLLIDTGGYIEHNPVTGQDSAAVTYDIAVDGDIIIWDSLTANRDVIIANATEGAKMELALNPIGSFGGFFLTIKRADTTTIRFLKPVGSGAGEASACKIIYKGGTWKHYAPTLNTA